MPENDPLNVKAAMDILEVLGQTGWVDPPAVGYYRTVVRHRGREWYVQVPRTVTTWKVVERRPSPANPSTYGSFIIFMNSGGETVLEYKLT